MAMDEGFALSCLALSAEYALERMGQAVWNQPRRASDSRLLACARMRSACSTLRSDKGSRSPNDRKVEPSVLSPKAITGDSVYPASALISSSMCIVLLQVFRRIDVHAIIYIAKFRVVFRRAIFEFPLIRRNVVPRYRHVEGAMQEE